MKWKLLKEFERKNYPDEYSSMFAAGNANFAKAQDLKPQLEAAITAAEVQAIVW